MKAELSKQLSFYRIKESNFGDESTRPHKTSQDNLCQSIGSRTFKWVFVNWVDIRDNYIRHSLI